MVSKLRTEFQVLRRRGLGLLPSELLGIAGAILPPIYPSAAAAETVAPAVAVAVAATSKTKGADGMLKIECRPLNLYQVRIEKKFCASASVCETFIGCCGVMGNEVRKKLYIFFFYVKT